MMTSMMEMCQDGPAEPEPVPVPTEPVVATSEEESKRSEPIVANEEQEEEAHPASAKGIDYSGVEQRGTLENCWSMKLKPGVSASSFEQQSLYGPFDMEGCLAWCLDPPWGPPRPVIIRQLSMCLLAGGQAVYDGIMQIQTVLGIISALIASMAVDQVRRCAWTRAPLACSPTRRLSRHVMDACPARVLTHRRPDVQPAQLRLVAR